VRDDPDIAYRTEVCHSFLRRMPPGTAADAARSAWLETAHFYYIKSPQT
jgi:hypothetical protein